MIVVPFRASGKSRLPDGVRRELSFAMLADVLAATVAVDATTLVADDDHASRRLARELGVHVVVDPGLGQGPAVSAALAGMDGPCLVVNSDLPAATSVDVELLAACAARGEFGLVEARDGTTNALALPRAGSFAALYGEGSAARFSAHAAGLALPVVHLAIQNLIDDVDTLRDLDLIGGRAGERTRLLLALAPQ